MQRAMGFAALAILTAVGGDWRDRSYGLTSTGQAAALAALRAGPSLRGGSAVPQPECGQRQARECYQRAYDLKGVVV